MNRNLISSEIAYSIKGGGVIPESLKQKVIDIVEHTPINANDISSLNIQKIKYLDKVLIKSLTKTLTNFNIDDNIIDEIISKLTLKAQQRFSENANIYLLYLILKPDECKSQVYDILQELKTLHGGAINKTLAIAISACTVIIIIGAICTYVIVKRLKSNESSNNTNTTFTNVSNNNSNTTRNNSFSDSTSDTNTNVFENKNVNESNYNDSNYTSNVNKTTNSTVESGGESKSEVKSNSQKGIKIGK